VGVLALGCSSSGDDDSSSTIAGQPLDCAWLAGDNCWKDMIQAAMACVPPSSESGTLTADGSSCSYASGTSVTFNTKIVLPFPDSGQDDWDFSLASGGTECLSYHDDASDNERLTVQGMTYSEKTVGVGLQVTCPDGTQYAAQNAFDLLNCTDFFSEAPGYAYSDSDTSVNFALLNGTGSSLSVFDCSMQ